MQKRFFLIIILMFLSHIYASPKPIEAEQLNSRALKKGKDYIANNSCEENQSSCVYIMKRIIDMNKLAIMVNNGYSKSDIKKALFNQKELNYNKNLLAIKNEKSRE